MDDFDNFLARNGLKARDAWSVVLVYDTLATPLAKWLAKLGVKPNSVTFSSAVLSVVALVLFVVGHPLLSVVAMNLATVADCTDGKVARLSKTSSTFGAKLDKASDFVAHAVIPLGIALELFARGDLWAAAELVVLAAVLARVHLKGIFNAAPLLPVDTGESDAWDRWCARHRLNSEPVAETEIAFFVPSLVVLETAFGLMPVLSILVFVLYLATKAGRVYRIVTGRKQA